MPNIAVCIPTFRRPAGLLRCLKSLEDLTGGLSLRVIVGDNDVQQKQGIEVCRALEAEGFKYPLKAIPVEQRGIAPNRNALVAEAISDADIEFIAMIDDDEWAHPEWLSELMRLQKQFDADIVGGPVLRTFETPVPDYVARANLPDYSKIPSGKTKLIDATSNIMFRSSLFKERTAPWFDPQYALMGCEDRDILTSFMIAGKTFAWANMALVTEEMPTSRCSAKWMLQRAYRVGNTDTIVNMKHRPPGYTILSEASKILGASFLALGTMGVFFWHPARRFEGARLGARVAGKVVALLGRRHQEYVVIHGR